MTKAKATTRKAPTDTAKKDAGGLMNAEIDLFDALREITAVADLLATNEHGDLLTDTLAATGSLLLDRAKAAREAFERYAKAAAATGGAS
jgi:hypothetical protein